MSRKLSYFIIMGCNCVQKSSTRPYSVILYSKASMGLAKTQSLLHATRGSSVYSAWPEKCLKLKIFPYKTKFFKSSLVLSGTPYFFHSFSYTADYNFIKETYTVVISGLRHFLDLVHEVCVSEFNIHNGIFIMFISIFANKEVDVTFFKGFPYFTVKGILDFETLAMVEAWQGLINTMQSIDHKKIEKLTKAQMKLEEFSQYLKKNSDKELRKREILKGISRAEHSINISKWLISECQKINLETQAFFISPKKKLSEISNYIEKAKISNTFAGERIVHTILPISSK